MVPQNKLPALMKEYTSALRQKSADATGTYAGFNSFLKEKGLRLNAKDEGAVKVLLTSNNRPAQYLQDVKARRQDAFEARRHTTTTPAAPQPATTTTPQGVRPISTAEIEALPNRVLQDFARMGYGNSAQFLANSPTALKRLEETSNAGVRVTEGESHGRSFTTKINGQPKPTVFMAKGLRDEPYQHAAGTFLFEMNNAHRWNRFEELNTSAKNKIGTKGEYAQKKMELEVEGMLHTGKSGKELVVGKHANLTDMKGWYVADYHTYDQKVKALPKNMPAEQRTEAIRNLRSDIATERLDVPHGNTSHRKVYESQFETAR
ncbi:hypothetical protein LZ198_32030 [Myxococcus sp. K15C18031901]|uniref:hypothetical protein n=1 Tax=Myxococcus dinghuensis TaxID=2906761 RepID=UPI0020A7C0CD|nr:hypothetical protein [Myxococcus dinghuensis]MCP3103523.1 hypothetical protein [Myxococcus dinghuensis]